MLTAVLAAALAVAPGMAAAQAFAPAWLGIGMDNPKSPGEGVLVTKVVSSSPAERAGLKEGDHVVRLDGAPVATPRDVQRAVFGKAAGETVSLTVHRASGDATVKVTLAPRPDPDEQLKLEHVGKFAPTWTGLEAAKGDVPRSVGALRGRVVVIDFWATWCSACRMAAPAFTSWQARYGAQGLTVIGITTDEKETAAVFAARNGLGFAVATDTTAATSRAYDVSALPTTFVVDKRGVVRDVAIGYDPDEQARMESLVRTLLAEPAP